MSQVHFIPGNHRYCRNVPGTRLSVRDSKVKKKTNPKTARIPVFKGLMHGSWPSVHQC